MNQPAQQLAGRRRAGILDAMQQGLTQPAPPRISIKAQRFTLVDAAGVQIPVQMFDQQFGLYLDVVIIGVNPNKSKIYYEFDYDPTKDEPPTCFSDNGVGPSAQAAVPQHPACATCPNNAWGSDTSKMTGKATKACSDRKKLAVIVVNDPAQLVYQLQIPPASLKNLAVLATVLKSHQVVDAEGPRAADPADVVTRIYFNPQKQGELLFQPMGFHQQMAPYITPLIDKADTSGIIEIATGSNDVPYSGAIALPNPQVMQALPAPAQQVQAPPPPPAQFQQAPVASPQQHPAQNQFTQAAPQFQQAPQTNGQQPPNPQPGAPAPRTRRGGARQGAGRPAGGPLPQAAPQPQAAPFQQAPMPNGQPAPFQPMQQAPQPAPFQQPAATGVVQPAPFQMQAAPPADPAPGAFPDAPAFLQVQQPVTAPAPQPTPAFGMTNAPQPDPGLSAALTNAFGAPMLPRQR